MKRVCLLAGIAAAGLLAGCSTKTTIYDPGRETTGVRSERNVSSEEFREVARAAVNSAMTNPKVTAFLQRYTVEMNDEYAIPVLKLDRVINDTDDPSLNVSEMTDILNECLINAGKVDVTMAEGAERTASIGASRDIAYDDNFDQSTVAQKGTLQAARLVLRPKVISNLTQDGDRRVVVRTFVMEMADIKTGLIMWKFTKQLGFMREKGTFGW